MRPFRGSHLVLSSRGALHSCSAVSCLFTACCHSLTLFPSQNNAKSGDQLCIPCHSCSLPLLSAFLVSSIPLWLFLEWMELLWCASSPQLLLLCLGDNGVGYLIRRCSHFGSHTHTPCGCNSRYVFLSLLCASPFIVSRLKLDAHTHTHIYVLCACCCGVLSKLGAVCCEAVGLRW